MRTEFPEIKVYGEKSVKCDAGCGHRIRRKKTFWQTLSPFNKKADGSIKNVDEVYAELRAERDEWKAAPMTCKTCTAEALGM